MSALKAKGRPGWVRIVTLLSLALLIAAGVWLGPRLYRVWHAATALRSDVRAARALLEDDIEDIDLDQAVSLVHRTEADLSALQTAARPFLWLASRMGWLPRYGPTLQASPVLLQMGVDLTAAGRTVVDALLPLLEQIGGDAAHGDPSLIGEAAVALSEGRPQLEKALTAVQQARSARDRLYVQALDPRLHGWMEQLDRYLPPLEKGLRAGLLAPEVLGAQHPSTYLLIVQNEDELRATGGFISGVAQVTVSNGQIDVLAFEDSYAVDDFSHPYPEPPAPLAEIIVGDLWLFRDSNWSPDFPTSARKAVQLFTISRDVELDGVIALDQQAISLLLGPLGPIRVEGSDEPLTGQNVIQVAREAWAPGKEIKADWWLHRKDIMGDVLDAAMQRLEAGLDRDQLLALGSAALQALREKHLLLYLEDQKASTLLRDLRWDGALGPAQGDCLMVVDSNLGFNKVNAVVQQSLDYQVYLTDPNQPRAKLTVHHHHPVQDWSGPCSQEPRYSATYEGMTQRCYYDYLRVYVPGDATLLRATPHPVAAHILLTERRHPGVVDVSRGEMGRTVFATLLVLEPGNHMETVFVYDLASSAIARDGDTWRYHLTVQKQPGTDRNPLQVTLRLPTEAQIVRLDPAPSRRQGRTLIYNLDLQSDLTLAVAWQ